ncbi:hypothetical protein BOTBODRAFT_27630 [Botryobasidium botryosum FD-172 SS1]|uniref:Nucleoporin NDC1 n=1 Tax=Botryobasidium botryosum (strain FD-172 SS1) TaxID=930990 RepID=A0A067MZT8_BOTB1|nr:hypothetical protein BOTBODRAFT_27630 [Botryobasidium botryosum FD-172 SS1]
MDERKGIAYSDANGNARTRPRRRPQQSHGPFTIFAGVDERCPRTSSTLHKTHDSIQDPMSSSNLAPSISSSIYLTKPSAKPVITSSSYEAMCKYVLRNRQLRMLGISCFATWFLYYAASLNPSGASLAELYLLFSPTSIVFGATLFVVSQMPPLILRKVFLHPISPARPPTMISHIRALLSLPRSYITFATYVVCGGAAAVLHCRFITVRRWAIVGLDIFAPTPRHPFHLNERFLFLMLSNAWLGLIYAFKNLITSRTSVRYKTFTQPLASSILTTTRAGIKTTLYLTFAHSCSCLVAYFLFRRSLWRLVLHTPILGTLARPYIVTFLRPSAWPFSVRVIARLFILNATTGLVWEFTMGLFDVYTAQPIFITQFAPNPNATLIAGLHSSDVYLKHHACHELAQLSRTSSLRRKALFSDLKGSTWSDLCRELLLVLGKDYRKLQLKGKPAPAASVSKSAPPPNAPSLQKSTPATQIYRNAPPTTRELIANSLASDGSATKAISGIVGVAGTGASKIPRLFLGDSLSAPPAEAPKAVAKPRAPPLTGQDTVAVVQKTVATGSQALLRLMVPKEVVDKVEDWAHQTFFVKRVAWKASSVLDNRVMDVWAVEALSSLVAASFTEDSYGAVQRDIPRIIEALTSFLGALEEFLDEIDADMQAVHVHGETWDEAGELAERERMEREEIIEVVGPILDALRGGLQHIISTFGDRLVAFKFPPKTAKRLQAMIDM